ncbi:tail fiber domain-containing protein [bacterium]
MYIFKKYSVILLLLFSSLGLVFAGDVDIKLDGDAASNTIDIINGSSVTKSSMTAEGDAYFRNLDLSGTASIQGLTLGEKSVTANGTELNYVDGVTSAIQTQLNTKASTATPTFTGDVTLPGTGKWDSTGKVGIGSATPTSRLEVIGSDTIQPLLVSTGTSAGQEVLVVTTNGYVGIGTTDPTEFLHVEGNIKAATLNTGEGDNELYDMNQNVLTTSEPTFSNLTITQEINVSSINANDAEGLYLLDDGDNGLFIEDGGYVGIGTNNPTELLEVDGNIKAQYGVAASTGEFTLVTASSMTLTKAGGYGLRVSSSAYLAVDGGNVGIGTTSPIVKLEVSNGDLLIANSNSWQTSITNENTSVTDGDWTWSVGGTSNNYIGPDSMGFYGGNTESYKLVISSIGNVGIGTTQPSEKLEVNGTAVIQSTITLHSDIFVPFIPSMTGGFYLMAAIGTGQIGYVVSSLRYKKNIRDLEIDSSKIYDLKVKTFEYKQDNTTGHSLIAEEAADVEPAFAIFDKENLPATINLHTVVFVMLDELQKLQKRVEELESK